MANELHEGKVLYLKMPYGELFSQQHSKERTVFIAGGTGITPYLSLFTSPSFRDYAGPRLYFGFRDERYHEIFKDDLGKAYGINRSFDISLVNQQTEGMLNIDVIYGENGRESVYFISGPPVMIHAFKEYLAGAGVGADNIRTDNWE
ncbi:MAG: hypothetical protein CVV49_02690 [Spirochaetae bacterium HGW-Spirochaetae-5]|nr:MAG: hypothetical protein CVV49_02690 [Spirochaetae bacterium HGW-Spirochaetae-5]